MAEDALPAFSGTSIRPEMVNSARQFLLNDKVRKTPFDQQKSFLKEKGLTDEEIEEALKSISPVEAVGGSSSVPYFPNYQSATPDSGNNLSKTLQSAAIIGSATYFGYKFIRSWVLPRFFDIPDPAQQQIIALQTQMNELQNSTKFIMDSVVQTLETVSAQQEQLNRALVLMSAGSSAAKDNDFERLHADIGIVKSLLLNQNQFPAIPNYNNIIKPIRAPNREIESQQIANDTTSTITNGHNGTAKNNGQDDSSV
ncbi:peroxisomal membrane anchor protein (Pex14p) conserved region domain-containing protein [Ditylenchus destructor]|uniref:Peroxisomal membrane protein PEX14 n=1 Tax=Ditylenchus destructor TaxID=166010 RepID=A0AAD4NE06_9BILA|nr:peroxisomal membrane anchor protein (Pex14p) conserved region domain-containing protein [Ditylenchus destructor]